MKRRGIFVSDNNQQFTDEQKNILENFVSNTTSNIFALRNLPEVIKGALFSRYSRSSLGLRSLLLKEFILNDETSFSSIANMEKKSQSEDQIVALQKAQSFYDRILDGYGDDSIGELGGAHLALENISILAAKVMEDCRIGGSPLEKSTRYIYFDQKVDGLYNYYREEVIMTSAYRDLYINTCDMLFDTYSKLIPPLTAVIEQGFPKEHQVSKAAYASALRAKVLDCLRGLLPASTLTNMGLYGNGRFYEYMLQKLATHNLVENQEIAKDAYAELSKVIPSFIRRAHPTHKYFNTYSRYKDQMTEELKILGKTHSGKIENVQMPKVKLISSDSDCVYKLAAALLFEYTDNSLESLEEYVKTLSKEDLSQILDAACNSRDNRRHKSPRALEHVEITFEFTADFGIYRDLQRHRTLTQSRQLLSCDLGYYIPEEIIGTDMEKEYIHAMDEAKKAFDIISKELPEEAQYVVPMAYNMRWYFHVNLRSLQWICELRSSPAGHPNYRFIAQEMTKQICDKFPEFERYFKFVDFDGYDLGRMDQEVKKETKKERLGSNL